MAKRNETYMSPADIEAAGQAIFGDNWRAAMSDYLDCDRSLLYRYMTLKVNVPKVFAVALQALQTIKDDGHVLPTVEPASGVLEPISRAYAVPKPKRTKRPAKELSERVRRRRSGLTPD